MSNFTNSPLISLTRLSPNRNSPRNQPIRKITIHHFAGNSTIEGVSNFLANPERQASYNYGIGSDGRIVLIVNERDRCWGSSSPANDHQAVVIGVANNTLAPSWGVSDTAYRALIDLCVCICQRNGIAELTYDGTPEGSLTRHNMFSRQTCPGPTLQSRFPEICALVNARLGVNPANPPAGAYPVSEENIQAMIALGIISSPDYWRGITTLRWLDRLMQVSAESGLLRREAGNGIQDLETALKVLNAVEIMNSPDYWLQKTQTSGVRHLDQLIINIANRVADLPFCTAAGVPLPVDNDDVRLLQVLTHWEARGEDEIGQIIITNVVFNRMARCGGSVRDIVFHPGAFSPTRRDDFMNAQPNERTIRAVDRALRGEDFSQGATFFHAINRLHNDVFHVRAERDGRLVQLHDHGNHRFWKEPPR